MTDLDFYKNITPFSGFSNVFDEGLQCDVPRGWFIVLADVKGSTQAVAKGQYKDVNVVGASCIIAVLNAVGRVDIPYVFGGDGASFLIPESLMAAVAGALIDTQQMARDVFGLSLRIGAISVAEVQNAGQRLAVAKYAVSDVINIAMFHGGGLAYAEGVIKSRDGTSEYALDQWAENNRTQKADFSGLQCRWNPVAATKDQIVTLMVTSRAGNDVYERVIEKIADIYGGKEEYSPVTSQGMSLSPKPQNLKQEFGVQTHGKGRLMRFLYMMKLGIESIMGMTLFKFDLHAAGIEGKKYIDDVVTNTDFQKFDDTLRIILDSRNAQTEALLAYLDNQYKADDLFYGVSISSSVMMTCLIFERTENHLHFVDGMAGGYTMAAKNMKEQIRAIETVAAAKTSSSASNV